MKFIKNFLKGIVIGIATLVPGVSGGTMAIILGIYDDLIHSIGHFFEDIKAHTMLLLEVGLGGLTALILFSKILESALASQPFVMRFLFIGVICGGIPVLYKKSTSGKKNKGDLLFLIIGFIIVLLMGADPAATTTLATSQGVLSIVFLLIAGVVVSIALILPGISASFMLLTLNLYDVTLNAVNNRNVPFLIPLGIGVVIGVLATTRGIENLLKRYPSKTYLLILGFVIGSIIPVFPGIPGGISIVTSLIAFIIGFIAIRYISEKDI
ncbi:DUF368 domain-containing protein [Clostridium sp. HMP27]|nr:DUF368 domain-containing protein [Clostridium sp. HMP27]KGK87710.1 membrane protein [Clostridium sp. HMP27]